MAAILFSMKKINETKGRLLYPGVILSGESLILKTDTKPKTVASAKTKTSFRTETKGSKKSNKRIVSLLIED